MRLMTKTKRPITDAARWGIASYLYAADRFFKVSVEILLGWAVSTGRMPVAPVGAECGIIFAIPLFHSSTINQEM